MDQTKAIWFEEQRVGFSLVASSFSRASPLSRPALWRASSPAARASTAPNGNLQCRGALRRLSSQEHRYARERSRDCTEEDPSPVQSRQGWDTFCDRPSCCSAPAGYTSLRAGDWCDVLGSASCWNHTAHRKHRRVASGASDRWRHGVPSSFNAAEKKLRRDPVSLIFVSTRGGLHRAGVVLFSLPLGIANLPLAFRRREVSLCRVHRTVSGAEWRVNYLGFDEFSAR
jgi:hypothetical protein